MVFKKEAFSYFEDALELDPHLQSTINNLSTLNLMLGRFDQARAYRREHAGLNDYDPAIGLAIIDAVEAVFTDITNSVSA